MLIYLVRNKVNNKVYIGQTVNTLRRRWYKHLRSARKGSNNIFHRAIRKYGAGSFELYVVGEPTSIQEMDRMEEYFISITEANNDHYGYNMTLGGEHGPMLGRPGSMLGRKHTEEAKAKIGAVHKGKVVSEETRAKISKFFRGRKQSAEHIAHSAASRLGKPCSSERRARMRAGWLARAQTAGPEVLAKYLTHKRKQDARVAWRIDCHFRRHINRGLLNPKCSLCMASMD